MLKLFFNKHSPSLFCVGGELEPTAEHRGFFPPPAAAFTLVELLAVVAIIAALAILAAGAAGNLNARANQAHCIANLRQISNASLLYSGDNNGRFPPCAAGVVFAEYLLPYFDDIPRRPGAGFRRSPLVCPAQNNGLADGPFSYRRVYSPLGYGLSYAQNDSMHQQSPATGAGGNFRGTIVHPTQMALYLELDNHYLARPAELTRFARWQSLQERHGGFLNIAFVDGSVRQVLMESIPLEGAPTPFWQGR